MTRDPTAEAARLRAIHTPAVSPLMADHPHEHQWVPWYNVWFGKDCVPKEKEFSNGRGCLICHIAEPVEIVCSCGDIFTTQAAYDDHREMVHQL